MKPQITLSQLHDCLASARSQMAANFIETAPEEDPFEKTDSFLQAVVEGDYEVIIPEEYSDDPAAITLMARLIDVFKQLGDMDAEFHDAYDCQ